MPPLVTSPSTTPRSGTAPQVTAPTGTGFVVIPGAPRGRTGTVVTQPTKQPALPGSTSDAADFYGLAGALLAIVVVIFVVRRIVPLRREQVQGRHPAQPPEAPGPGAGPEQA